MFHSSDKVQATRGPDAWTVKLKKARKKIPYRSETTVMGLGGQILLQHSSSRNYTRK
jgi:hypothetical protein